jgi:hypothetical protein
MTPSRAKIVTFCAATLTIVGGAAGLLLYSGRGPVLIVVGGPGDPVFFDPNADEPQPMPPLDPAVLESIAVEAGVRPEIAFAMAKTGVYLMKENEHLYTDEDKEDFWAAVEEYRKRASHYDV